MPTPTSVLLDKEQPLRLSASLHLMGKLADRITLQQTDGVIVVIETPGVRIPISNLGDTPAEEAAELRRIAQRLLDIAHEVER